MRDPLKENPTRDQEIKVGDKVVVDRIYTGIVKYIGRVGTKKHSSLGIELDTPSGENNGSRAGRVYFQCKPRHGVFRESKDVKAYRPSEYNQTGIINTTEIEEVTNSKAFSELLNDNVEIQRRLEDLTKENKKLTEQLEEEKKKRKFLEIEIEKYKNFKSEPEIKTENLPAEVNRILAQIINQIKEKIETENKIFNINTI